MSSFDKVPYADGVTVIGAENLNAIQDELIRLEQDKQDTLTIDDDVTPGSTNPVSGGAVATALGNVGTTIGSLESEVADIDADIQDVNAEVARVEGRLDEKVDKEDGKGLSANDFTDDLKAKLDGIEEGATKVEVDEELSDTSENPVQNKVVSSEIAGIKSTINDSEEVIDVLSFLFAAGKYMSTSGLSNNPNCNCYKISLPENAVLLLRFDDPYWTGLGDKFAMIIDDGTTKSHWSSSPTVATVKKSEGYAVVAARNMALDIYVNTVSSQESNLKGIYINSLCTKKGKFDNYVDSALFPQKLHETMFIRSKSYIRVDGVFAVLGEDVFALAISVKAGDSFVFDYERIPNTVGYCNLVVGDTVLQVTTKSFSVENDGIAFVFVRESSPVDAFYIPANSINVDYANILNKPDYKVLANMTIAFLGDSITSRYLWEPHVLNALGGTGVNCGMGSTPLSGPNENAFWQDIRLNAVKEANPDVLTILGGANDLTMNPVIGDETNLEDQDTGTFIGAYSYIISSLLTWKPSLKIVILSTTWAHNDGTDFSSTVKYGDFAAACKLVARHFKLPFVDLYNESGVNAYTISIYSGDNIHPNDAGAKIIASMVIDKIKQIYGVC